MPAGGAGAQQRLHGTGQRQQLFDFMVVGVGNEQLAVPPRNADGMLQAHMMLHAVAVAKGEQVDADQGSNAPGGRIQAGAADAAGFGVGKIQQRVAVPVGAHGDAAGLRQGGRGQRAVVNVFAAGAGVRLHDAVGQRQPPQLVRAGHSDVQNPLVMRQIPGAAQRHLRAGAVGAPVVALFTGAGDGVHRDGVRPAGI